jgi:hypothetical protein
MHACNIGVLEFLVTGLYVTIWLFFAKALASRYPDSACAKALAFIYQ